MLKTFQGTLNHHRLNLSPFNFWDGTGPIFVNQIPLYLWQIRQQQDEPKKGNGFAAGGQRPVLSAHPFWVILLKFYIWLVLFSLLEHEDVPAAHSGCTGGHLLAVTRMFAVSPSTVSRVWSRYQELGHYTRRAGQGRKRATTQQQDLLLCARRNRKSTHIATHVHVSDQTVRKEPPHFRYRSLSWKSTAC